MATKTELKTAARSKSIQIVLVDDHPLMREGLAEVLRREPDLEVCGEAEDRTQALEVIKITKPDLVIVDLALKNSHGLELVKDITALYPKLRTLVVSMHDEFVNAERVIRAGSSGYITKQEATTKILLAVRCVLSGEIYLSPQAAAQIASKVAGRSRAGSGLTVDGLADRELQVFELIGRGHSTRQIAEQLKLDVSTIETYRARIKEKLNLKDSVELLQHAISWNSSFRV